jgi:hypothetical protein
MRPSEPANVKRIVIAVLIVAAIVVLLFATGWADDRAPPGTRGRATVNAPSQGSP